MTDPMYQMTARDRSEHAYELAQDHIDNSAWGRDNEVTFEMTQISKWGFAFKFDDDEFILDDEITNPMDIAVVNDGHGNATVEVWSHEDGIVFYVQPHQFSLLDLDDPMDIALLIATEDYPTDRIAEGGELVIDRLTSWLPVSERELDKLSTSDDERVRMGVAGNAQADIQTLERMLNDESDYVLGELAQNSEATESILTRLAESDNPYVRTLVALNNSAPTSLLEKLVLDEDEDVREVAHHRIK
jgi:hypothetical protein